MATAVAPPSRKTRYPEIPLASVDAVQLTRIALDDLATGDGSLGYASALKHGEIGKGLNDYDAIFRLLAEVGFEGWISVEAGMEGTAEIARSVAFLKRKRAEFFQ